MSAGAGAVQRVLHTCLTSARASASLWQVNGLCILLLHMHQAQAVGIPGLNCLNSLYICAPPSGLSIQPLRRPALPCPLPPLQSRQQAFL